MTVLAALLATQAEAALLTSTYESQLETWLGQGNLTFTNIFTKQAGDDAVDFHAAADGQGATFTLMRLSGGNATGQIIGGYNPLSWNSSGSFSMAAADASRTAFLYNLTTGTIQRENLIGQGASGSGQYQAFNWASYGPTFGGGFDLQVTFGLNFVGVDNYSYGGTTGLGDVVDGSVGGPSGSYAVTDLEVYQFTAAPSNPSAASDTAATGLLLLVSAASLIRLRRRSSAA